MMDKRKIQECLLNIDMTCRSMYLSYHDVKKLKIPLESIIYGDMVRYSYIQLCSILDEFVILNGLAKHDSYLKDTLYTISPALRAINKFTGIRKARNYMLAHFNRDKKRNFHPWWFALRELKLPRTQKEINQIYIWLQLINSIVVTRYHDELKEISDNCRQEFDDYMNWVKQEEQNAVTNPTPLDNIFEEVNAKLKEKCISNIVVDSVMTELVEFTKKNK